MKIALYGATGMIGQRILREALNRGHYVTAIVRNPAKLTETHNHLTVVTGDILNADSIAETVKGANAVVSAYGPSGAADSTVVDAAHALIAGLTKAHVKRLIVVGGAGSLEVAPGVQLIDTPDFPESYKAAASAARDALGVYKAEAKALDWTYISPAAMIAPGKRTNTFRLGGDQLVVDAEGNSRISAEDFAVAIVDELDAPKHIKQRFTAAY
ncbi:3-beta hydroxysteroid dehydrogenase [Capsulimonas corticalis]|uniref:3-beta hydroxysteroid dehydrogenase n=1 Tax=Capsulimonas corticalis TaxID=2219043 RepID=A0A402CSJ9_9BACT|nr:NAD(P)-dependent oxidoreductase [Capsulimonas corticalis]BDI31066.1 3-beta hydroxysteroid dehydrogenase [Capsulimonas corticalis]